MCSTFTYCIFPLAGVPRVSQKTFFWEVLLLPQVWIQLVYVCNLTLEEKWLIPLLQLYMFQRKWEKFCTLVSYSLVIRICVQLTDLTVHVKTPITWERHNSCGQLVTTGKNALVIDKGKSYFFPGQKDPFPAIWSYLSVWTNIIGFEG